MERIELKIGGMSCGHCVHAVGQALKGLDGVQVERVEIGSAVVAYDPAVLKPEAIKAVVVEEGYEVRSIGAVA